MEIKVDVKGFEQLFKNMDELKDEIGNAKTDAIWRSALREAFQPVFQSAKDKAPVDTGQLDDHIKLQARRPTARDKRSQYYKGESYMVAVTSSPIRDSSYKKTVLNRRGKFQNVWANVRPVPVSQEFGNARTPAHPYLRVSLESNYDVVIQRLRESLSQKLFNEWDKLRNMSKG
jgi:hypothetical protein